MARFYCEAFVGILGLPDEKSDISWHRLNRQGELEKLHTVEIVKRCVANAEFSVTIQSTIRFCLLSLLFQRERAGTRCDSELDRCAGGRLRGLLVPHRNGQSWSPTRDEDVAAYFADSGQARVQRAYPEHGWRHSRRLRCGHCYLRGFFKAPSRTGTQVELVSAPRRNSHDRDGAEASGALVPVANRVFRQHIGRSESRPLAQHSCRG